MYNNTYVPGKGALNPDIMFVGEAPSHEEVAALEPFVGPSGRFLNELCSEAGINRLSCWVSNVSKYMVKPNFKGERPKTFQKRAEESGVDLQKQIEDLRVEIREVNPKLIVALGKSALWAITGKDNIQDYRGSILLGMNGIKTIGTYHPAHILHSDGDSTGYWNKQVIIHDLKRAKEQSKFRDIVLPRRNLQVCSSSGQLYDFINRYRNYKRPSVDIEAIECIPVCIGISFTKEEGITIPLWNTRDISSIPDSDLAVIWTMLARFLASHNVVGQNFGYDRDKIKRLGFIVKSLASDTMLKSFVINPELPTNLAFNTSLYTLEPFYKNEGMYEGSLQDLFIGCARDACVTKEIDEGMDSIIDKHDLRSFYEKFILPLHTIYHYRDDDTAIEQLGFCIDESKRDVLMRKYIAKAEQLRYNIARVVGEYINPKSPPQVKQLLYEKWKLPFKGGTSEEDLTIVLNSPRMKNELQKMCIEDILEARRVERTISNNVYALPDFDGRMRTSYYLCLDTGRSATSQQKPPIRPSEKYSTRDDYGRKVTKKQARGTPFQTMTKHGDIGADVRGMYIPLPGHVFLQADSSQAEARVIFILADDHQALKDIDEHDYHALTASWFFGGSESDYSKKLLGYESPIRFAGKTLRHAGHLGAGARKAAIEVNTQARKYGVDYKIDEGEADRALKIFHAKQPKIKQVFQNDVIKSLQKNRVLVAPVPFGIDANVAGRRTFFERWNDELFRQAFSYLPQRTVSENTKGAALRIRGSSEFNIKGRAEWIQIVMESHDALLCMVPIERREEAAIILKEELERPIDFSACSLPRGKLVIPCEIEEGYNYLELSKFKWLAYR